MEVCNICGARALLTIEQAKKLEESASRPSHLDMLSALIQPACKREHTILEHNQSREIRRLLEALKWYADISNYELQPISKKHVAIPVMHSDNGKRAREALGDGTDK